MRIQPNSPGFPGQEMPPPPQPAHSVSPASTENTGFYVESVAGNVTDCFFTFLGKFIFETNCSFPEQGLDLAVLVIFILKWIQQFTSTRPSLWVLTTVPAASLTH